MRIPGPALLRRREDRGGEEDLKVLARTWAGTYDITHEGRIWAAACRHGIPVLLTAGTPDGLGARIADDWMRRRVR